MFCNIQAKNMTQFNLSSQPFLQDLKALTYTKICTVCEYKMNMCMVRGKMFHMQTCSNVMQIDVMMTFGATISVLKLNFGEITGVMHCSLLWCFCTASIQILL